jgi:SAM-dependent methyltransferase
VCDAGSGNASTQIGWIMTELHPHCSILRCPRTGQALRPATPQELEAANVREATPPTVTSAPTGPRPPTTDGVTSADGRFLYPVVDGIYVLLAEAAIELGSPQARSGPLSGAKAEVRQFYENEGWNESVSGAATYVDGELFEDSREVSADYRRAGNDRVTSRLAAGGRYLLDAASGPIQYPDYLKFSAHFDVRVCLDFSMAALRAAGEKLGGRGLLVLGDMTNLPIANGSMDAVVSLHTIYHVPADEQARVFTELYRVVKPGGRAVIVYQWKSSFGMRLFHLPLRIRSMIATRFVRRDAPIEPAPALYFAPHSRRWFIDQHWPFAYEIATWRTLTVAALRGYVPASRRGQRVLDALRRWEDTHPRLSGRFASYPLITIDKPSSDEAINANVSE